MTESVEERLQDLEQLVLKQAERIDALESQLAAAMRMAAVRAARSTREAEKDAA